MRSAFFFFFFFSKSISVYAIFNDQTYNDKLINDIVNFEQLGPDYYLKRVSGCLDDLTDIIKEFIWVH